jgi:hypothetical protein
MANGDIAPTGGLANILALIQAGTSKKSSTSSTDTSKITGTDTSTTKSNITAEGMNAIIQQILGGTQGLAAIASGQKSAGLYGGSTNQLLLNDLITRTAGELAKQQAGTTTTNVTDKTNTTERTSNTTQSPQVKPSNLLGTLAMAQALTAGGKKLGPLASKILQSMGIGEAASTGGDLFSSAVSAMPSSVGLGASIGNIGSSPAMDAILSSSSADLLSGTSFATGADLTSSFYGGENAGSLGAVDFGGSADGITTSADALSGIGGSADLFSGAGDYSGYFSGGTSLGAESVNSFGADVTSEVGLNAGSLADGAASSSSGFGGAGYLSALMQAYKASQTDGDYRAAIGDTFLTAFGQSWAIPIANRYGNNVSDSLINQGQDVNGLAGSFSNDPIGTLADGKHNFGDVFAASTDPTDLFGGNPGGSLEGTVASVVDPIGSAFGAPDWTGAGIIKNDPLLSSVGDAVDDLVDSLSWIVCTELLRQGKMPKRFYVYGAPVFAKASPQAKRGYYWWAVPAVQHIRKHPDGKLCRFLENLFVRRAEYLSAKAGCKKARKLVSGAIITATTYGICWTIGAFVGEKDFMKLYGKEA